VASQLKYDGKRFNRFNAHIIANNNKKGMTNLRHISQSFSQKITSIKKAAIRAH